MDPDIKKELQRQKDNKIDQVKKEMAWAQTKHQLTLDKVQTRLVNNI